MAYLVEVARSAEAELQELYLWLIARAPGQAAAWFNGLEQAILSLKRLPKRCRIAPESYDSDQQVRVLSYGRNRHIYRVFFTSLRHALRPKTKDHGLIRRYRELRVGLPSIVGEFDLARTIQELEDDTADLGIGWTHPLVFGNQWRIEEETL